MKAKTRKIELLAPAKNLQVGIAAIDCGADAVYIGAQKFGARHCAGNSVEDIAALAVYAHQFGAKVYVTVNTLVYEHELTEVEQLIHELYRAGADALIVQDMSVLRMDIPPIALHASTQCDLRTPQKAKMLQSLGFSQLVMARELSAAEIREIHAAVDVPIEAFVHGALCVSYSGRCQASQCLLGRSANRGECAQVCRFPFDLVDEKGNILVKNKHLLSLRDLNMSDRIEQLLDCGVSSLKIEGRLKDEDYVRNIVAYYRKKVDAVIDKYPQKYSRSSFGTVTLGFEPHLEKSFNRSFTTYFFDERHPQNGHKMASIATPKSQGEYIGEVISCRGKEMRISTKTKLANGDGLSYFASDDSFTGLRVNKVERGVVFASSALNIASGTKIYRTFDKAFVDSLKQAKTERRIAVYAALRLAGETLALDLGDERGNFVTQTIEVGDVQTAKTDQTKQQTVALEKLGGTIYYLADAQVVGNKFIPSSTLNELRRKTVDALNRAQRITCRQELRANANPDFHCEENSVLNYADNVANSIATSVYEDLGCIVGERAIETGDRKPQSGDVVMHTRYCIRRELGMCRLTKAGKGLPEEIYLQSGKNKLRVVTDCRACEMMIKLV